MSKTRLYKVNSPAGVHLVEARSPRHAIVHVVRKQRKDFTASVPQQHEIYNLAKQGVEIEVAGSEPVSEGTQAALAQGNLDV